jgi:hypothetical protein
MPSRDIAASATIDSNARQTGRQLEYPPIKPKWR